MSEQTSNSQPKHFVISYELVFIYSSREVFAVFFRLFLLFLASLLVLWRFERMERRITLPLTDSVITCTRHIKDKF